MAKRTTKRGGKGWRPVPTARGTEVLVRTPGADPEPDPDLEPAARELTPDEEDVEEVVAQIPQEARIQVWRYENDDWAYLTTAIPHGFTLDALVKRWGGGKYRLVCRGPKTQDDGTVKIVQIFKRIVSVAAAANPAPGSPGAPMIEQGLSNLLTLQSTMLGTLMQQINGQRDSTATMIQAIGALVKPPPSFSDDLMKLLLTKVMNQDQGGSSLETMLAVLDKGMELGAAAEGGDGLGSFAKMFADLLKEVRDRRAAGGAPAPEPKQLPEATVAGHIEPKPDDPRVLAARKFFMAATAMLEAPSQQNGDLDLWAEAVIDLLPRELDDELEQWLNDPTYPDPVMGFFPGVAAPWLRALLLKVRDLLTEDEPDDDGKAPPVDDHDHPAGAGGPGDGHDAPAHAPVRQRGADGGKRSTMRPNRHGGV